MRELLTYEDKDLHIIINIYQVILLIAVLVIIIKLHNIKFLLLTFIEHTKCLCLIINRLDKNLKQDDTTIEQRVNKLHGDIAEIMAYMKHQDKEDKK